MKKISLAIISGGLMVSIFAPGAEAHGFKIRKDALEQVDWFHGKRQVQIVDDDIEVRDLRRRRDQAPYVEIRLDPIYTTAAPTGAAGTSSDSTIPGRGLRIGQGSPISQTPSWKETLPQSGFGQSNIPTRHMPLSPLPPGYNTGVHASLMQARSAAAQDAAPKRLANRGDYIKPPLKSYPRYNTGSGIGSDKYNYSGRVYGQIKRGSLINDN